MPSGARDARGEALAQRAFRPLEVELAPRADVASAPAGTSRRRPRSATRRIADRRCGASPPTASQPPPGPHDTIRVAFIRIDFLSDRGGQRLDRRRPVRPRSRRPRSRPRRPPPHNRNFYQAAPRGAHALLRRPVLRPRGVVGDVWPRDDDGAYHVHRHGGLRTVEVQPATSTAPAVNMFRTMLLRRRLAVDRARATDPVEHVRPLHDHPRRQRPPERPAPGQPARHPVVHARRGDTDARDLRRTRPTRADRPRLVRARDDQPGRLLRRAQRRASRTRTGTTSSASPTSTTSRAACRSWGSGA